MDIKKNVCSLRIKNKEFVRLTATDVSTEASSEVSSSEYVLITCLHPKLDFIDQDNASILPAWNPENCRVDRKLCILSASLHMLD